MLLGLRSENELVRVPLFSRYREQAARPFVEFRAVLKVLILLPSCSSGAAKP